MCVCVCALLLECASLLVVLKTRCSCPGRCMQLDLSVLLNVFSSEGGVCACSCLYVCMVMRLCVCVFVRRCASLKPDAHDLAGARVCIAM